MFLQHMNMINPSRQTIDLNQITNSEDKDKSQQRSIYNFKFKHTGCKLILTVINFPAFFCKMEKRRHFIFLFVFLFLYSFGHPLVGTSRTWVFGNFLVSCYNWLFSNYGLSLFMFTLASRILCRRNTITTFQFNKFFHHSVFQRIITND